MGKMKSFFGRKKMSKNVQEQVQNQVTAKREEAKKNGKTRRYCLLVEDFFESTRMQGVMVIGNIHGRVRVGDTMYLYQPNQPAKEVCVTGMELGPRDVVETAKDCQVGLCLNLEKVEEVSRYAVLSSVRPLEGALAERVIENQRLFGLMMEYERLYTNSVYMDALLYELCYAKFVVPLHMKQQQVQRTEDGTPGVGVTAYVEFSALKKSDDDSELVFPAFTDEVATMSWKDAFKEGELKRFATMQLPHLIQYVKNGHTGLVINPFGPVPVCFSKELLDQVEQSEVFVNRYVKPAETKKQEDTMEE